jgi:hypothetical protein
MCRRIVSSAIDCAIASWIQNTGKSAGQYMNADCEVEHVTIKQSERFDSASSPQLQLVQVESPRFSHWTFCKDAESGYFLDRMPAAYLALILVRQTEQAFRHRFVAWISVGVVTVSVVEAWSAPV